MKRLPKPKPQIRPLRRSLLYTSTGPKSLLFTEHGRVRLCSAGPSVSEDTAKFLYNNSSDLGITLGQVIDLLVEFHEKHKT